MEFRIADTFTDSLVKLNDPEQKAVKTTAFDLQVNAASPGMQFHKLDKPRDKNFWSIRVSKDIRLIVHRTDTSLLLCYVGHHDDAYRWAERRKLQTHPKTGAAQLVEVRETIQEVVVPKYVEVEQPAPPKPALFAALDDDTLLSYGVPSEWLGDVRQADEDTLLELTDRLPAEAAEALLELATGGTPRVPEPVIADTDPFEHPDAQRRFRVMTNVEELQRALDYPWEKWTVFLHPAQRDLVERQYGGPARVSGSAGTGKTVVALHRGVFLAKDRPEARILLTTFSDTLADALRWKLRVLVGNEPRVFERIEIHSVEDVGQRIFQPPFSWRSLGVDVRGRSRTLRVNYRTSHQIRQQADRLLPPELADVDGNAESRRGTVSVFNGPDPVITVCRDTGEEAVTVAAWVSQRQAEGLQPHEVGVFVRSASQFLRARAAIEAAGLEPLELREHFDSRSGHVSICTMHLAKGLEFRAVVVMACDDEIIPLQERIEAVADDADLEEVYNTERHLLYVACTRARDQLLVTGVEPASEFLDDLMIEA